MPPKFKFTKDQIADTALQIVRRQGWEGLTTRSLADELGTSARPIYSFFKSMAALEEEIVKRAVDLLYHSMTRRRTDDPWHDHGIGYVLFAVKEKHLFRSINDEKHLPLFKKYGDIIWATLTTSLSEYPPFQGLSEAQIYQIQLHRWLYAHGLAFSAGNPIYGTWTRKKIVAMIEEGSQAIYTGLMSRFKSTPKPPKKGRQDG